MKPCVREGRESSAEENASLVGRSQREAGRRRRSALQPGLQQSSPLGKFKLSTPNLLIGLLSCLEKASPAKGQGRESALEQVCSWLSSINWHQVAEDIRKSASKGDSNSETISTLMGSGLMSCGSRPCATTEHATLKGTGKYSERAQNDVMLSKILTTQAQQAEVYRVNGQGGGLRLLLALIGRRVLFRPRQPWGRRVSWSTRRP